MKILLIHNYYQYLGGEESYFESSKKLLEEKGHTVITYTKNSKDIKTIFGKIKCAFGLFWNFKTQKELNLLIEKEKPNLVHIHNLYPLIGATAYRICRKNNIPIIQHVHNYRFICPKGILFRNGQICELCVKKNLPFWSTIYGCYHKSKIASVFFSFSFYFHIKIKTLDFIDKFIFPSEFTKNYYQKNLNIPNNKEIVIPYFVNNKQKKVKDIKKKDYFLFAGRLSEEKGIIQLLEIFKTLPQQKIVLIGDGPLKQEVEEYKKYKNIQIVGHKSHEEVKKYMAETQCLIISSLWYEVLPFVYLEAIEQKTAILIPNNSNFKSISKKVNNVYMYKFGDFTDLRNEIIKLTSSNRLKKTSSILSKYSQNYHYHKLINLYNMLQDEKNSNNRN